MIYYYINSIYFIFVFDFFALKGILFVLPSNKLTNKQNRSKNVDFLRVMNGRAKENFAMPWDRYL